MMLSEASENGLEDEDGLEDEIIMRTAILNTPSTHSNDISGQSMSKDRLAKKIDVVPSKNRK